MINTNNKIRISNTGVTIHPYRKYKCKELEKWTSIRLPNRATKEVTGFFLKDIDTFVTHPMSLSKLQSWFPNHIIEKVDSNPSEYIGRQLRDINFDLRPDQAEIIDDCISLSNQNRVFLCLPTGFGKTILAIYLTIKVHQTKTLVICPSKLILDQWQIKYTNMGNIPEENIMHLHLSTQIDDIMSGKVDISETCIFVCTQALLKSYAKTRGWEALNELAKLLGIGTVFVDEAHNEVGGTIRILGFMRVRKVYYLSADFNQAQKAMKYKFAKVFDGVPIVRPSQEQMDELRHLTCNLITFNSKPTQMELNTLYDKFGFRTMNYSSYQLDKGILFDLMVRIMKLIFTTLKPGRKIVIMTTTINAVDEYTKLLRDIFYDKKIKRFHSNLEEDERQEIHEEDVDVIVSTYMSLGVGIDIKGIQHVMSLDLVNEVWDNQAAGRARPIPGEKCFYYLFADYGFTKTRDTLNVRLNYMRRANVAEIRQFDYM